MKIHTFFKGLIFVLILNSCKTKPVITDNDLKSSANKEYEYSGRLSDKEIKYFSKKLKSKKDEISNQKLYSFIKSWEHTTYLYGGNDKNGIDCSAITQRLYSYVYKTTLPRTSVEMFQDKRFKNVKTLEEGDLVFFKIDDEKIVSHVGVYLKNNFFFSSSGIDGCNISSLEKKYWQKYFIGAKRLKNS